MTPRHPRRYDGWSSDDEARLIRLHDDGLGWEAIAEALGRTRCAVQYRASRLGLREARPRWTPAEDARLIELRLAGWSWTGIARELGRQRQGVISRAWGQGWLALDGPLGATYGTRGVTPALPPPPPPDPTEYVLIVENDNWHTAIARGDRAEVERIYRSMHPKVLGLRIEAA